MSGHPDISLNLDGVSLSRGGRALIDGLSLQVSAGEALWLTGPNGVGKTTILLACAGLVAPDAGFITWSQPNAVSYAAHRGPERDGLTLGEELAFWQQLHGDSASLTERLESVGLSGREATPVAGLSAGQRRRLSLACLIASNEPAWLLDEPLAGLDAEGRALVETVLSNHLNRGGLALIASHQPVAIAGVSARKLVLTP